MIASEIIKYKIQEAADSKQASSGAAEEAKAPIAPQKSDEYCPFSWLDRFLSDMVSFLSVCVGWKT